MRADLAESSVLIRDFRRSDLNDLLVLLPLCFGKEFEVSGFDPDRVKYMVSRGFGITGRIFRGLLRTFGKEPIKILVAETRNKVIATTIINDQGRVSYVSTVMVHPDYRQRGIASRLMKEALQYARQRKKARVMLHVDSTNMSAIGLYTKLGLSVFEHIAYFLKDVDVTQLFTDTGQVEIRPFQKEDLEQVYDLIRSSADPNQLRIHDFGRNSLKTPFLARVFRFSTQKKMVAVLGGRIAGYVEATYSTPKVAGAVSSIYVASEKETKASTIEKALVNAAYSEIAKSGTKRIRVMVLAEKQELAEMLSSLSFKKALVMNGMAIEFS